MDTLFVILRNEIQQRSNRAIMIMVILFVHKAANSDDPCGGLMVQGVVPETRRSVQVAASMILDEVGQGEGRKSSKCHVIAKRIASYLSLSLNALTVTTRAHLTCWVSSLPSEDGVFVVLTKESAVFLGFIWL